MENSLNFAVEIKLTKFRESDSKRKQIKRERYGTIYYQSHDGVDVRWYRELGLPLFRNRMM